MLRATAFASIVLPVPGTSSSSTCPSLSNATSSNSITASLPTITRLTCCRIRSAIAPTSAGVFTVATPRNKNDLYSCVL